MCFVDMSAANCLEAFLCIVFRRGFLLGWQPCTPIWCRVRRMVWALTSWPPTSLISAAMLRALLRRKHLDVTLSMCAQFLWTTYPRPVLSGPRTFKTLDDLSHCAAAQFQGVSNLLIYNMYFELFWGENKLTLVYKLHTDYFSLCQIVILSVLSLKYLQKCERCTHFCDTLYMCVLCIRSLFLFWCSRRRIRDIHCEKKKKKTQRKKYTWNMLFLNQRSSTMYIDLRPGQTYHSKDSGSDTFRWPIMERNRVGGLG